MCYASTSPQQGSFPNSLNPLDLELRFSEPMFPFPGQVRSPPATHAQGAQHIRHQIHTVQSATRVLALALQIGVPAFCTIANGESVRLEGRASHCKAVNVKQDHVHLVEQIGYTPVKTMELP